MEEDFVRKFATDWVDSWNSHDIERILEHYSESVELTSPVAARLLNDPAGTVRGKTALRSYFARGLEFYPDLRFELIDVAKGLRSVVLYYRNQAGIRVGEFMEFGEDGKVIRVVANYGF
jgi:hypothetical protein